MSSINAVTLLGNLGKNPEVLKKTDKGLFVKLQLATIDKYRDANNTVIKKTEWHTIYLNNRVAQFAVDYLNKGDKVCVEGAIRTNKWKDKSGVEHTSFSIFGKRCQFISGKLKAKVDEANSEAEEIEEAA